MTLAGCCILGKCIGPTLPALNERDISAIDVGFPEADDTLPDFRKTTNRTEIHNIVAFFNARRDNFELETNSPGSILSFEFYDRSGSAIAVYEIGIDQERFARNGQQYLRGVDDHAQALVDLCYSLGYHVQQYCAHSLQFDDDQHRYAGIKLHPPTHTSTALPLATAEPGRCQCQTKKSSNSPQTTKNLDL